MRRKKKSETGVYGSMRCEAKKKSKSEHFSCTATV